MNSKHCSSLDYAPEFPVYCDFPVLEGIEVEGFRFGKITDFAGGSCGEAFVIAPDGSRAGIIWEVSTRPYFEALFPMEFNRWGVWAIAFPGAMKSREEVARNLTDALPLLKAQWEEWRRHQRSNFSW